MTLFLRSSILLLIATLFSCQAPTKELTNEVEESQTEAAASALEAVYETITDEQGLTTLKIAITPPVDDNEFTEKAILSSGKVLFDKYQEVLKQKKSFDFYKVTYGEYSVVELSRLEMTNVIRKKKVFEERITLLENKKYEELYATLDEHYRTLLFLDDFKGMAKEGAVNDYSEFTGFQVAKLAGDKYLRLARSNADGARAIMTFKLNKEEDIMFGFEFKPAP